SFNQTKFEQLPNEIIVETFDYLEGTDLLFAFNNINYRTNKLLQSYYRYRFNFQHIKKSKFDRILQQQKQQQIKSEQIQSLTLVEGDDTCGQLTLLLSLSLIEYYYEHLQSLSLYYMNNDQIEFILPNLYLFQKLTHINVHTPPGSVNGTEEWLVEPQIISSNITYKYNQLKLQVLTTSFSTSSTIEYLTIDHYDIHQLEQLF
ncbi:unnamed protein product, partial [Didymodactylos carnosus]